MLSLKFFSELLTLIYTRDPWFVWLVGLMAWTGVELLTMKGSGLNEKDCWWLWREGCNLGVEGFGFRKMEAFSRTVEVYLFGWLLTGLGKDSEVLLNVWTPELSFGFETMFSLEFLLVFSQFSLSVVSVLIVVLSSYIRLRLFSRPDLISLM